MNRAITAAKGDGIGPEITSGLLRFHACDEGRIKLGRHCSRWKRAWPDALA